MQVFAVEAQLLYEWGKIMGMITNNLVNMFYGNFNVGASETSLPL